MSYSQIFCKCSWYFGLFRFVIRPPWDVSVNIYKQTSKSLYRKLSLPIMMFIAMWCGGFFAALAFVQIWIVGLLSRSDKTASSCSERYKNSDTLL